MAARSPSSPAHLRQPEFGYARVCDLATPLAVAVLLVQDFAFYASRIMRIVAEESIGSLPSTPLDITCCGTGEWGVAEQKRVVGPAAVAVFPCLSPCSHLWHSLSPPQ